jgi:hypothetical protein
VNATAPSEWWDPKRPSDLTSLLSHRRWWRHLRPFPHVRAVNVFRPEVYAELEGAFQTWLAGSGGGSALAGHDLQGTTVTSSFEGPLRLFASTGWHQLIARTFAIDVTPHVALGLHHHRRHSQPGFPHNDLNPGWFPDADGHDPAAVLLADPHRVDYTSGRSIDPSAHPFKVVRAVALMFYLANPEWDPSHRGETGLYRDGRDDPAEPSASVAPHSNSLLAFECTPWSFHGFQGGGIIPRNAVVQWLHRLPDGATARWGPDVITDYGRSTP